MIPRDFKQGLSTATLSVPETAAYLNVSVESVRRLMLDGQIYGFRLSRKKVRLYTASVVQYLDEQQTAPAYDYKAQRQLRDKRKQMAKQFRKMPPATGRPLAAKASAKAAPKAAARRVKARAEHAS